MTAFSHPPRRDADASAEAELLAQVPRLPRPPAPKRPRVLAVTSGKAGVGKTNIAANLAIALGSRGLRVLLVDADPGLPNLARVVGLEAHAPSAPRAAADNTWILSATRRKAPSHDELSDVSRDDSWRHRLISELDSLGTRFDAVVLDTGAGWVESRRGFATEAQDIVVVVSPDPTALSDAYGTVRALTERCGVRDVLVLANQVAGARDGSRAMQRLQAMCSRLTDVRLHDLGSIPFDPLVRRAGMRRRPVSLAYPGAPASRALDRAADLYLDARPVPRPLDSTLSSTPHTPAFAGATQ